MAAIKPSTSKWNFDDDVLLTNAVEAGASLESLARGAVQFSQHYTLDELRQRWTSLLYDPTVSSEFINRAAVGKPFTGPNQSRTNRKRNSEETVRRVYYDECRKARRTIQDMVDILNAPSADSNVGDVNQQSIGGATASDPGPNNLRIEGSDFRGRDLSFADPAVNAVDSSGNLQKQGNEFSGFCDFGCSSSMAKLPFLGSHKDTRAPGLSNTLDVEERQRSDALFVHHSNDGATADEAQRSGGAPSTTDADAPTPDYLAAFADQLLDLSDIDGLVLDADALDPAAQSYYEAFSALLVDPPNHPEPSPSAPAAVPEKETAVPSKRKKRGRPASAPAPAPAPDKSVVLGIAAPNLAPKPKPRAKPRAKPRRPPSAAKEPRRPPSAVKAAKDRRPECPKGVVNCALNEQDPNIPDNDDVFIPFRLPLPPHSSTPHWVSDFTDLPIPLSDFGSIQMPKEDQRASATSKKQTGGRKVSFDLRTSDSAPTDDERARSVSAMNAAAISIVDGRGRSLAVSQSRSWADEGKGAAAADDGEGCSEGDFGVPSFEDVEATILEMDLVPERCNLLDDPEVQRLQHDASTIIRLEQAAEAQLSRALASRRAFSLLFGHSSQHFIKKPEVLIGRAVEEIEVDIDLGQLENGNKVSRRQAVIKLDAQGTFALRNVGKKGVSVNGVEVLPGQWHNLAHDCLIEMRGLEFIFKVNAKLVQEHVNSLQSSGTPIEL